MPSAKDIRVAPISRRDADALIIRQHYSHKTVQNAYLALGVFLEGAMTFGPSMDKSNIQGLVRDTGWHGFLELNRLVFTDALPRNSESRALGIALRMIRKTYPQIEWVISFADGCQCGDGTIYRAAGFVLTAIRKNHSLLRAPDGTVVHKMAQVTGKNRADHFARNGGRWSGEGTPLAGYQLRYIYFLNPAARARLTCPEIPYSEIERRGAGMYRGIARGKQAMAEVPSAQQRRPPRSNVISRAH
ncbi:hypothetical protein [Bradyrhizobium sp. Cp5.3]|uniref:Mom family adenine methylcarbamoylation protein n=1 Tax=Bradyrhizobium sp. Cp5.3 TaxID=443598 RepID=UPI0003FF98C9|nr:hypothetical protein [Bradyrhizobium sp. Cp5.3]